MISSPVEPCDLAQMFQGDEVQGVAIQALCTARLRRDFVCAAFSIPIAYD